MTDPGAERPELIHARGPHTLVDDVDQPELASRERHHLERSLRLRPSETFTVGDGAGRWRVCTFGDLIEPTGPVVEVPRAAPVLTVGFALVKQAKPELVVQKLTELGIDRIVPFVAGRSVVRWDSDRAGKNHDRLVRVAREAVMQCRRAWLPEISPLVEFEEISAGDAALADPSGRPVGELDHAVLIGPEGGWTDRERDAILDKVVLADHVLRSETAAIAAATLMTARRRGFS